VVPKKGGIIVVKNEKYELISIRTVIGWGMCIGYWKLNSTTQKDHFLIPFVNLMLERLARNFFFCYLDEYLSFF